MKKLFSKKREREETGGVVEGGGETISVKENWSKNSNAKQEKHNSSSGRHHHFNQIQTTDLVSCDRRRVTNLIERNEQVNLNHKNAFSGN
jgi:hypothetical protein